MHLFFFIKICTVFCIYFSLSKSALFLAHYSPTVQKVCSVGASIAASDRGGGCGSDGDSGAVAAAGGCDHVANFSRFACRMRYLSHVHKIASPDRKIVFFQTHSFEKFLLLVLYAVVLRQ